MTTATQQFAFDTRDGVARVMIRRSEMEDDRILGPAGLDPFTTLVDDNQTEGVDRRRRLGKLLDDWTETVSIDKSHGIGLIETMGEGMEPFLTLSFARTIREALQGNVCVPLGRFAAVGVAWSAMTARASIGELHTANTLDELGSKVLIGGMGFADTGWGPYDSRYLVMNLDRDKVDPSLNLSNVIGGLLFAERCWPETP